MYGQIDQSGSAEVWAAVCEARTSYAGGTVVGLEIDCTRTSSGLAVGIDVINRALGSTGTLDYGIRLASSYGAAAILGPASSLWDNSGGIKATGYYCRSGTTGTWTGSEFNFQWVSGSGNSYAQMFIDTTGLGYVLLGQSAYVAGAPTATGFIPVTDSKGTTYKILVST